MWRIELTVRGRAVHGDDRLGLDYWVERNLTVEEDQSALPLWDRARAIRETLASDPMLAELHEAAVAWRKTRFLALLEQDRYRDLYGRLLMCAPSRPVPPEMAQALAEIAVTAMGKA